MSEKDEILAAIASLRTESVTQQVKLQRTVDRIATDQLEVREVVAGLSRRVDHIETRIDSRVKHSDHVHANASEVDAKTSSDLAAVIVATNANATSINGLRDDVRDVRAEFSAMVLENRKQSALLTLIRGSAFKRLISETTKLVTILAAIAAAYLAAKGHQ